MGKLAKNKKIFIVLSYLFANCAFAQSTTIMAPVPEPTAMASDRFTIGSSFRFRNETLSDTDYATYRSFSSMRIRTDLNFKVPEEHIRLFLQPQFSKYFGEPTLVAATTSTNASQNTSGTTVDPEFLVHQGYLEYASTDWYKFVIGRQVIAYGDELVIGGLDWNNVGRSFDGAKVKFLYSMGWLDLIYLKLVDNNVTTTSASGDIGLSGVYNSLNLGDYLKSFDVYYFQKDDDSQFLGRKLFVAGARVASQFDGFDYRAEYTKEWGTSVNNSNDAYQHDIEIGYKFVDVNTKPRLAVEAFTAGKEYDTLYTTAHKWLGFADVFGRRNITGGVGHFSFAPTESLTTLLDYHYFSRTSADATAYKTNGTSSIGSTTGSSSLELGSEIDLTLKYKVSKSFSASAGYSYFSPGEYLKKQFSNKTPEFYFAQLEALF